jgi:hypothetical protein
VQHPKWCRGRRIARAARQRFDIIHHGARRATPHGREQCVTRVRRAVGREFDAPVGTVSDPASESQPLRLRTDIPAKSYTLYSAGNPQVEGRHAPNLVPYPQQCCQRRG